MESRRKASRVDETDTEVEGLLRGLPPRYRPRRILGHGSQKCVYLAHDATLDRDVAIAAIEAARLGEATHERLHEARTMARIGDLPHVVPIYDVIEVPDHLFIVSRYFPGGDLAKHLKAAAGRILPVRRALDIGAQIALALAHAHDNGVSHRDVKPGNVFLDARGQAFLGDFGIAVVAGGRGAPGSHGLVGTLAYMAPEQIWGASSEPTCDLYALGAVLYELVCGAPPFVGSSPTEVLYKHENETPVPPLERNPAVPAALNDLALKLLAKRPEDRPSSCHEVHAALQGILRSGAPFLVPGEESASAPKQDRVLLGRESSPPGTEPLLIARVAERSHLEHARARAWAGQPRVLLLSGEAGVGKSRLLRELRARAEAEGGIALVGQGYEDVPLPYRSIVEALVPLAARLSELGEADAALLRRLLHLGGTAELAGREETEAQRLFFALSRALATFARTRPLLLVIEDLHWVDRASLDVFEHIAFGLARGGESESSRILLVGSHRPLPPDDRTARALGRLALEERCEQISLDGLDEHGVFELVRALGIEQPSSGLVRTIWEGTGGNPLFVREVVTHLERGGAIERRGGGAVVSVGASEVHLPVSLDRAVSGRVAKLGDATQRLLTLGALLGHRFDLHLLALIAEQDEDAVVDALEEAVRDRLLVDEGQSYVFGHPVVRQVILQAPSASRRQRLHLRIASRLEQIHAARPTGALLRIAHHLVRAGDLAAPARVVERARGAAFQALSTCAWHEAAEMFEAALAASRRGDDVATRRELADLHAWAGFTYARSDDRGPCLEHLDAAIAIYREVGDRRGSLTALHLKTRARIDFGMVTPYGDHDDIRPLEEGLADLAPEDDRLRARILGTIAIAHWTAQAPARASASARRAIELARTSGDDRLCGELSVALGLAQFQQLELAEALATWQAGLEHARRAEDLSCAVACVQRMPFTLFMLGELDRAEQMVEEGHRLNRTAQNQGLESLGLAVRASIGVVRGDWQAVRANADRALDLLRRTRFPWTGIMADVSIACSFALRGEAAAAGDAIDQIFVPGRIFDDPSPFETLFWPNRRIIEAYAGRRVELGDDPPGFVAPPPPGEAVESTMITPYCLHVELADFAGRPEFAARVEPVLAFAEERGVALSVGWPLLLPRVRGIAAMLAGRRSEAEAHLRRAVALAERIGARPELARSRLDLARLLAASGDRSDRTGAADLLRQAADELHRSGMPGFLERARSLAAELGIRLA
jgi:tetratricopeptide (TPR) repeat protein